MYISPRYSVNNWKILNLSTPSDWRTAVRVLKDRLNARFFDAAEAIDQQDFAGFAVLALNCLLIETLQQSKEGVHETPRRRGEQYFVNFLTTAPFFPYFTKASAAKFYCHFRCGILHQAEIKASSKVRRVGPLVAPTPDGATLRKAFAAYLRALRNRSDALLFQHFVNKMNHICNP
jgi:hypothetical protein